MKLFKNRTVLGIFCIAVSLIICFAITPLVNAGLSKKVTIVRFNKQVNEGEEITRNMLDVVEVGNHNLPENVIRNVADVEGKYLTTTVYAGDYILTDKISDEPVAENKYLYSLNGEKQAMSITINTFAEGLSGKLKSGDIVSIIAPDYLGSGETIIPVELKYVEVIAVTAKSGYDANTGEQMSEEDEKELPSTVTILVRPEQSKLLARLEAEGEIHLSLVFRGDADKASEFIKAQDQVLDEIKAAEEEALQEKAGYPERDRHHEKHEEFKKTIRELHEYLRDSEGPTEQFSELVQKNVVDWLFGHIKTFDRSVAEFIFIRENPDRI